jgi:hypothetical protein
LTQKEDPVSETTTTALLADSPESVRIRGVVRRAAEKAFRARVRFAIRNAPGSVVLFAQERRQAGLWGKPYISLVTSPATATRKDFLALAELLNVEPRWLAIGYGPSGLEIAPTLAPPAGWDTFGTNLDHKGGIEFSTETDPNDGMPLWERPVLAEAVSA